MRTRDPAFWALFALALFLFCMALISTSISTPPILWGKSASLWVATTILGSIATVLGVIGWTSPGVARFAAKATKLFSRFALLFVVIPVLLYELAWFLFAQRLPIEVLVRVPDNVKALFSERTFERDSFRTMFEREILDDPILGFKMAPNLDIPLQQGQIRQRLVTDRNGFCNVDKSLYDSCDVVVTGDSFTAGSTVEFDQSWPQQFRQLTGLRTLNLASGAWDVYQYPRVLESYGIYASPKIVVVTLTNDNDLLNRRYYDYADFRSEHGDIEGYRAFCKKTGYAEEHGSGYFWISGTDRNYLNFVYVSVAQLISTVAPFTSATYAVLKDKVTQETSTFVVKGTRLEFLFYRYGLPSSYHYEVPSLSRIADDLEHIRQLGISHGFTVYFVYLPKPEEIYLPILHLATEMNDQASEYLSAYQSARFDIQEPLNQYRKALGDHADLLFDATPYLQRFAAEGENLAWTYDFHPNALGARRIAEFVAEVISKQGPIGNPR